MCVYIYIHTYMYVSCALLEAAHKVFPAAWSILAAAAEEAGLAGEDGPWVTRSGAS